MKTTLVVSVIFLALGFPFAPQTNREVRPGFGAIEGLVLDAETGDPIAKARVMAQPDDTGSARKLQSTLSDEKGNFFLNDLSPGPYVIPAAKEEEATRTQITYSLQGNSQFCHVFRSTKGKLFVG